MVSLFVVLYLVIQLRYSWQNYFLNKFNLFNDFRKGCLYFIIDKIISECINFLIRHDLKMVYQSTFSFEYLLFSFPQAFLLVSFIIVWLQLINLIITHQLHHYLSCLISFSFKPWIFWQLPSCFQVSSYFWSFFGCY